MTSSEHLITQVKQYLLDIRDDRASIRSRSLDFLSEIFERRIDALINVLNRSNDDDALSWTEIFISIHEAIKLHCMRIESGKRAQSQKSMIDKNFSFEGLFKKCVSFGNLHVPHIPYANICKVVFECFETTTVKLYFGQVYLNCLFSGVLNAPHSLGELKIVDWSRILSHLFKWYKNDLNSSLKTTILSSIALTVRHGTKYKYLAGDLQQYIPDVIRISNETEEVNINALKNIQPIVYEFMCNLAINQRFAAIKLSEHVLDKLLKLFHNAPDPDFKEILFKIMHISIVIHSPEPLKNDHENLLIEEGDHVDDYFKKNIAEDTQVWYRQLRLMLNIVEREIRNKRNMLLKTNDPPKMDHTFVQLAAKLCSVVFWTEGIWNKAGISDDVEQPEKRHQCAMHLERIMDNIEYKQGVFCSQWLTILSQILVDMPDALKAEDYQPLLKMLYDYMPKITYPIQMKQFIRIVNAMLNKEHELLANSTIITESFCTEHWHKIMQISLKQAVLRKMQLENIDLLCIMIKHKVIVSLDFIKEIINEIIVTLSIQRTENAIKLLIVIIRNVNIDVIDGIQEQKIAIVQWLGPIVAIKDTKKLPDGCNSIDKRLEAELYVLCILLRQDSVPNNNYQVEYEESKDAEATDHDVFIEDLCKNLQYRTMSRLIISDHESANQKDNAHVIENLPEKKNVKAYLNDTIFAEFDKSMCDFSDIERISSTLATNINILNTLIEYEAIDCENFQIFLNKRIFFKINQLNMLFKKCCTKMELGSDLNNTLKSLLVVWHDNYQPIIAENIFIATNSSSIIDWIKVQLKSSKQRDSLILAPFKSVNDITFEDRIQLMCLELLVNFSAYENSSTKALDALENYEFNYDRNEDLFVVMQLVKNVLSKCCPHESLIEWAFDEIKSICENHAANQEYMGIVADVIPDLIRCVSQYERLQDDLIQILVVFLKQSRSQKYGLRIALKTIKSVAYFAQDFFSEDDCFDTFVYLNKFLKSECLTVRFAAVECLTDIFNKKWLNHKEDTISCLAIQKFHEDLAQKLEIDKLSIDPVHDKDLNACIASTRLQLYCSIIKICYPLLSQTWFNIIEFCSEILKLNEGKTYEIIEKLCKDVFNSKPYEQLDELFPRFIALWIDKNYHLTRFPVKLAQYESHNDFIIHHIDTITLRILLYKSEFIPELIKMTESRTLSDILSLQVLVKSLARLTSIQVDPSSSKELKLQAMNLLKILRKEKPRIDDYFDSHTLEIIRELLNDMWDEEKFREYFEIDVEFVKNEQTINYDVFIKSLEYIQNKVKSSTGIIQYSCEFASRKIVNILYELKLQLQKATYDEIKLSQMLRICVLFEMITEFIIENMHSENQSNVIGFFVRDFVYFLGNIITYGSSDKLKLASSRYLLKFCKKMLPNGSEHIQTHLNYITSVLMEIIKQTTNMKISEAGMKILHFLIVDQTVALKPAIGQLDSFPTLCEFNELRAIQNNVKYDGKEFTLLDEIEYFLSVDKRKIEGLLSLKDHLSKKKNELQDIYKAIYESSGFSEDCERSHMHRLISVLLGQIVQNVDNNKCMIAVKCLAELGPSDLGSITLKFDTQHQTYKICKSFESAVSNLCEHAMEKLNGIFIHSDITVLQAAADACIHLLKSQKAVSFLDKFPLLKIFETGAVTQLPLKQSDQLLDFDKLFSEDGFRSKYTFWIKSLAIELFTLFGSEQLAQVAAKQSQFSTAMVPLLVKTLLATKNVTHRQTLITAINQYFSKTYEALTENSMMIDNDENDSNTPVYLNNISIKLILNIAECIRIDNQSCKNSEQLKLNYLHIAKAALSCEAYFTAILYSELASYENEAGPEEDQIRVILKTAHQLIGENDAANAYSDLSEVHHVWEDVSNRFNANTHNKIVTPNYDQAWRLADWDSVEDSVSSDSSNGEFDKYHYFALKNLKKNDQIGTKLNVQKAYETIIKMFKQSSHECTKNVYKNLMMLNMLSQIEDFSDIQFQNMHIKSIMQLITKWKHQDEISSSGFDYHEPILAQRLILFESGDHIKRKLQDQSPNSLEQMYLNLTAECREAENFGLAYIYWDRLQKMNLSKEMLARARLEKAQLHWNNGELETAERFIKLVIDSKIPSLSSSKAFNMMGELLAESRLERTNIIVNYHLAKAKDISIGYMKNFDKKKFFVPDRQKYHNENLSRNHQIMAKYAEREYQVIANYRKSMEFENKQKSIVRNKGILADMSKRQKHFSNDEKKSYSILVKTVSIDESDVKSTNDEYAEYLHIAVRGYMRCILYESPDEINSSSMLGLFGLWFSNISDRIVLRKIEENYKFIPTYKFIPLMTQITTHLCSEGIKHLIEEIIVLCALQHPHHVLPKILALVNAFKDDDFIPDTSQKSKISSSPRTDAATKLLQRLKGHSKLREIIIQMERMSEALIRLANTKLDKVSEFPANEPIRRLRDLDLVHCPTVPLAISISGDYTGKIVGIRKWKSTFSQPGGINAPKRIECIGSNGQQYSQLLKGTDDLRQDAVMQQVFNIMNDMLNKSKLTKKDRLNVRTYTIVPLSQRSGILEWCDGTMPLTEYLIGTSQRKGAHERFRPEDWPPKQCRSELSKTKFREKSPDEIYNNYKKICNHIQPVFHNFFLERFHNPGVWFERRMAYARSLATTSIIGYILGIGDRHVSNILIDKTTAELVHIDFGIAFEQGKCLPTPELIPFRLTRDMVSGLGPSGVEGVFRKSCEKTMEVLRQNKKTILTIVEVLLHDPLYAWALTSNQVSKRQGTSIHIDENQDMNSMAERALWRLDEKLLGKHVSRDKEFPVNVHVAILITEAMDEKLLCKLFAGWQPYL